MCLRSRGLYWLSLLLLGGAVGNASANSTTLTPTQVDQARLWVRQLSDRSFRTREQATQKLVELGRAGIKVLEEAVAKAPDLEARRRCERVLELARRSDTEIALALYMSKKDDSKLMKLASWERFTKLVGKDDVSKKLYVDMYCIEGSLLTELDHAPRDFNARFTAHCQQIQQNLYTPWGQANPIPHHRVVALLFMATDASVSKDVQTFYMLNNLFHQPMVQSGFRESASSRKLLMAYLEQRSTPQTSQQIFYIAKQLGLKEAMPLAVKVVNDKTVPGYTRGTALLFIGQMGGKDHIKDVEKILTDSSSLNQQIRLGNVTINTQMRDVALASLILMHGQNMSDYNFPYLQQFRGHTGELNLPPYYYGFSDDKTREIAFKRWKDTQAAPPKKK